MIIGEAIRTGPGAMPVFGPGQLSDEELHDVAAYLVYLQGFVIGAFCQFCPAWERSPIW